MFVGIMDDLELVGKENNAGCVGVMQAHLCFINEHETSLHQAIDKRQ